MKSICCTVTTLMILGTVSGCRKVENSPQTEITTTTTEQQTENIEMTTQATEATTQVTEVTTEVKSIPEDESLSWNAEWEFAEYSKIHDSDVMLYRSKSENRRDIIIAVNAGHGTSGGSDVKTLCHPDGSEKVTGGTTGSGATESYAISTGTDMSDGTPEAEANLSMARLFKDQLLDHGFDVLMIRDNDDTRLDNIARTVFANQYADYHIAIHYDGTENDKGAFYMSVPNIESYRNMYPVSENWQKHNELGEYILKGLREKDVKIWSDGVLEMDLTQTSYSTIPSIDIEVGDSASDHSEETQEIIAGGMVFGLELLVEKNEN